MEQSKVPFDNKYLLFLCSTEYRTVFREQTKSARVEFGRWMMEQAYYLHAYWQVMKPRRFALKAFYTLRPRTYTTQS